MTTTIAQTIVKIFYTISPFLTTGVFYLLITMHRNSFTKLEFEEKKKKVFSYLEDIKLNLNDYEKKDQIEQEMFDYLENNFDTNSSEEKK